MTISTTTNRVTYTGNGVTVAFSFPYAFFAKADLVVIETVIATGVQTTKTITTHYTISGSVDALGHYSSGGTVTAVTAPASTVTWTIYRDPTATQTTDLVENDPMPAESLEAALDYQTMLNQRTRDIAARSLQQPEGDSATIDRLPAKVDRASKYLAFDADGDPVATAGTTSPSVISAFMDTVLDDTTAAAARTTLGLDVAAKGDLFAATANDTLATLTVGTTTGHALVVDPSASTGLSYSHRSQPNPIINGNMEIWQRGTTFPASANNSYSADRWKWRQVGTTAVVTVNRSTNVPTVAQAGVLFNYSLEVDVTTADAAVAGGDIAMLETDIEGYNWRHFAQRTFIVSFWVRDTITGAHYLTLANTSEDGVNNTNYLGAYTITSSDTWEYKTVQVAASPSAGTWDYTNGIGLRLKFILMAGSNFTGATEGQWSVGGSQTVANSPANSLSSTANFFRITGVKMELGSVSTPIQFVPFEEELARCQRYYQKSFPYATTPAQNAGLDTGAEYLNSPITGATTLYWHIRLPVQMRTIPGTVTTYNPGAANNQVRNATDTADFSGTGLTYPNAQGFIIQSTGSAGTAAGELLTVHWTADAEL